MILAEKIQILRKKQGLSQEQLAEKCKVTRQSISKWEADIALPETEKLLLLSNIFSISLDILLKDDLEINIIKEVNTCGNIKDTKFSEGIYQGLLIKESISDENILDYLEINKVEIWKTNDTTKYWTMIYFTSKYYDFPERLSKVMMARANDGNWYCDFKTGNTKIIVFKDKILKYEIGDSKQKSMVVEECRKQGIPKEQMDWSE